MSVFRNTAFLDCKCLICFFTKSWCISNAYILIKFHFSLGIFESCIMRYSFTKGIITKCEYVGATGYFTIMKKKFLVSLKDTFLRKILFHYLMVILNLKSSWKFHWNWSVFLGNEIQVVNKTKKSKYLKNLRSYELQIFRNLFFY